MAVVHRLRQSAVAVLLLASGSAQALLTPGQVADLQARLASSKDERREGATAGYAQLIGFISDMAISGYSLNVSATDDTDLSVYKIPFRLPLPTEGGTALFLQGGINYARAETENLLKGVSADHIEPYSEAWSMLAGIRAEIPISDSWRFIPAFEGGIAHIRNDVHYRGADAYQARPVVDSLLINWSSDAMLASGMLGVDYQHALNGKTFQMKSSLVHTWINSFDEASRFGGFVENTDTFHLDFYLVHPLHRHLAGQPLSGVAHFGNTTFLGGNREALGFSSLNALGYAVRLDKQTSDFRFDSFTLGVNYLQSHDVRGYEIVIEADF